MISDQDQERIRQEEIFRQEIRREIAESTPNKTLGEKIWAFLNSPLGLWFLSTIAIGVLTWSFSEWQARRAQVRGPWGDPVYRRRKCPLPPALTPLAPRHP